MTSITAAPRAPILQGTALILMTMSLGVLIAQIDTSVVNLAGNEILLLTAALAPPGAGHGLEPQQPVDQVRALVAHAERPLANVDRHLADLQAVLGRRDQHFR